MNGRGVSGSSALASQGAGESTAFLLTVARGKGTFPCVPQFDQVDQAVAALARAEAEYASQRADATELLSRARLKREQAMRLVAALGVSHRKIAALTDLSHTRVNQILGSGTRRIPEAHLPEDFGGGPWTVRDAVIRLMATELARRWTRTELRDGLIARDWPMDDLEETITALTAEGAVLSADGGGFTIHTYGDAPPA